MIRTKSNSGFVIPLVIAIVVILAGGAVYFTAKNKTTVKVAPTEAETLEMAHIAFKAHFGEDFRLECVDFDGIREGNTVTYSVGYKPAEGCTPSLFKEPATVTINLTTGTSSIVTGHPITAYPHEEATKNTTDKKNTEVKADSQTSIKVISPNGGEKFNVGAAITVKWTLKGFGDNYGMGPHVINIDLIKNGQVIKNLIGQTLDTNSQLTITLPTSLVPGSDYKVRVVKAGNIDYTDESDNYFTVTSAAPSSPVAPKITLRSPKNGETVKIGNSFLIEWNTNTILPPGYKFVINAGANDRILDANNLSTSFSFNYPVDKYRVVGDLYGDVTPGQYKIKVSLYDGIVPRDADGRSCQDRIKIGTGGIFCNLTDIHGKVVTEAVSETSFTITN